MRLSHNDGAHTQLDPFLAGQVREAPAPDSHSDHTETPVDTSDSSDLTCFAQGGEAHNRQVSEDSGLGMGSNFNLGIIPEDMDTDLDTTLTEASMQQQVCFSYLSSSGS